ncbi:MAG TPA: M48 family metallopeptidase, partial [Burkholderiaceae bacterium]|nr:M48 family metallopeptidase [Burkholderiaceae bacterium]
MSAHPLTWLFAAALLAALAGRLWLATRQVRYVAAHRDTVPRAFAPRVSLQAHQRAADYTMAKTRFGLLTMAFDSALLLGWTLLGGLDALNGWLREAVLPHWGALPYQLVLLSTFVLVSALLDLPFEWWRTFRIEQRFGFNRSTGRLFVADLLKSALVAALLGLPLAALVLWIMGSSGGWWWLWAWAVWTAFNLLILVIYPTLIAPLFNKFEPLRDETLAARVQGLMQRCGFAAKGLFVMDGSRRSAHGNAYFTGFGAAKRVVFFDTLLSRLSPGEVEAVLAHELGHFKHKHVLKRMLLIFLASLG